MASSNMLMLVIFGGVALVLCSFALAFSGGSGRVMGRRIARVNQRHAAGAANGDTAASVRRLVAKSGSTAISEVLEQLIPRPAVLRGRLAQTGRAIKLEHYVAACAGIAISTAAFLFFMANMGIGICLLAGIATGIFLPHKAVSTMVANRVKKFTRLFPDAIDLIVRGLKSGLPVSESMNNVGAELPDPVGPEFTRVSDQVKLGRSLEDALWDTANRLGSPDFKFFVISLSVQRETGGNLAETLENLGEVLRKRQQMKLKIRAMSSEAKASAMIIGALPFIVYALLLVIAHDYASIMYTNPSAQTAGILGLLWMGIGVFIIKTMISFEI